MSWGKFRTFWFEKIPNSGNVLHEIELFYKVFVYNKVQFLITLIMYGYLLLGYAVGLGLIYLTWDFVLIKQFANVSLLSLYPLCVYTVCVIHRPTFRFKGDSYHFAKFISLNNASPGLSRKIKQEVKIIVKGMYLSIVLTVVLQGVNSPFAMDAKSVFFPLWFWDQYMPQSLYFAHYCFFIVFYFHLGLVSMSHTWILFFLTQNGKFQYDLLMENVQNLVQEEDFLKFELKFDQEFQAKLYKDLKGCIVHHKILKDYVVSVNKSLYYLIFAYSLTGMISIASIVLFVVLQINPSINVQVLVGSLVILVMMVITAYSGQILIDQSNNLHTTVSMVPWYLFDKPNQNLLRIFLMNSMKTETITTSGLINLDYQLFVKQVRTIYSLVTFFTSMM